MIPLRRYGNNYIVWIERALPFPAHVSGDDQPGQARHCDVPNLETQVYLDNHNLPIYTYACTHSVSRNTHRKK